MVLNMAIFMFSGKNVDKNIFNVVIFKLNTLRLSHKVITFF